MTGMRNGTAVHANGTRTTGPLIPLVSLAVRPGPSGASCPIAVTLPPAPPPGTRLLPLAAARRPAAPAASTPAASRRQPRRWPLLVIGTAAAVAIWSGWVALGAMCGFGLVQPLPGIVPWRIDTAITLPVSMEAYGAYALGVWLSPSTPRRARRFAGKSAMGSLALGTSGQVIYHLLAAAHAAMAPWPVTVLVACIPVAALAMAAALAHLLRDDGDASGDGDGSRQDAPAEPAPAVTAAPPEPASPPATPSPAPRVEDPPAAATPAAAAPAPGRRQPPRKRQPPPRQPASPGSRIDAARTLLAATPAMTVSDLMAAGVSEGTARRAKKEQAAP